MTTQDDVIKAAASLARDVAAGNVNPAALEAELIEQCRAMFGTVVGPNDPLWPLHLDVIRQGLAAGALSPDELAQWLAVARRRAGVPPEPLDGPELPADPKSSVSGPRSPQNDDDESEQQP